MKVTLVGCGFLGGLFGVEFAKRAFAYHQTPELKLIDDDKVENRNAANQLWRPSDEGYPKAVVLSDYTLSYDLLTDAIVTRVDSDNANELLEGTTILVCGVDNIPARQLLWKYAVSKQIPLLNMGISQGGTGSVDWTYLEKGFDSNPFSAMRMASLSEEDVAKLGKPRQLPPCELVGFRGLGLNTALAAAKALWILVGWDSERHVFQKGEGDPGTLTTWSSHNMGHELTGVFS